MGLTSISFPLYTNYSPLKNFFVLCLVLGVTYAATWFLADTPLLASIPIILVGALALWYARSLKLVIVYILFALTGAAQESFFILNGLWSYGSETFLSIPLYLPFVWGNIGILAIGVFKGILMVDKKQKLYHEPPLFIGSCLATLAAALATLYSLYLFSGEPLTLILALFCIDVTYAALMRSLPLALVGIVAMTCGSVGDLVSVSLGIWHYPIGVGETLAGVPPYIFIGWDIVGLLIVGFYLTLDARDAPLPRFLKD